MRTQFLAGLVLGILAVPAMAQDVIYRKDIQPMFKTLCSECHGEKAPSLAEFKLAEEKYKKEKEGPRTDSYDHLLALIAYPDAGALMRRLDDGSNTPDKKPATCTSIWAKPTPSAPPT